MMLIFPPKFKAMKGDDYDDSSLVYPRIGMPKIDGYRGLLGLDNCLYSPALKPVQNRYVHSYFNGKIPSYMRLDGELSVGRPNDPDVYKNTDGPLRRIDGEPDFSYWVFDNWSFSGGYQERYDSLTQYLRQNLIDPRIHIVPQTMLHSFEDLDRFTEQCLDAGFEGIMTRSLDGPYKYGRSTLREGWLLKHKPFRDDEARIISVYPAFKNNNVGKIGADGRLERSSHKENKTPKEMIGGFVCEVITGPFTGVITNIGPGCMPHRERISLFHDDLVGKIITFKHMKHIGGYTRPRQGRFWRFRNDQ